MMFSAPTLVTLYGDEDSPESLGFAPIVIAAAKFGKVGFKIGRKVIGGIAKRVKARRKRKRKKAAAVSVQAVTIPKSGRAQTVRTVPAVNTQELYAARLTRKGMPVGLLVGGAVVAGLLLVNRKGG